MSIAIENNAGIPHSQARGARLDTTPVMPVLYVEDNRLNILLFEEAMRGYPQLQLYVAEDSVDAVEQVCRQPPAVLVIDAHLPSMTGFDLLPLLRSIPGMQDIPAYMCSADASPEDMRKAEAAGFNGYWCKPIDIAQVMGELCRLAAQRP